MRNDRVRVKKEVIALTPSAKGSQGFLVLYLFTLIRVTHTPALLGFCPVHYELREKTQSMLP